MHLPHQLGGLLADEPDGQQGQGDDHPVQNQNLGQHRQQLCPQHMSPADGVAQQELGGALLFLLAQQIGGEHGREQGAADAQNVAALNGVEAGEGAEIQPIHAEGGGKGTHGGKDIAHHFHLSRHLREQENAADHEAADGRRPDGQGLFSHIQLVIQNRHFSSASLS